MGGLPGYEHHLGALLIGRPVDPDAIAWVKLEWLERKWDRPAAGTLFGTTFVQRLNTEGGLAPLTGCDNPQDIGRKAFIPYTADYFFYRQTAVVKRLR